MPKSRGQKEKELQQFIDNAAKMKSAIFIKYAGLKVKDERDLRKKLREAGSSYTVLKKTLLKRAFTSLKLPIEDLGDMTGSFAIAFGFEDEVSPAKVLHTFLKSNPVIELVGGVYNNAVIGKEQVLALAKLPTHSELLAQLVYVIASPLRGMANVLAGPLRAFVQVLTSVQEQKNS